MTAEGESGYLQGVTAKPKPAGTPGGATCRSIARECGLGHATVARALSGHPNVCPATRELVLKAAAKAGYRPDPLLSALTRRRWPEGARSNSVTIAYLHDGGGGRKRGRSVNREGRAAARRAGELGYLIEFIDFDTYPDGKRLSDVLLARGIRGVLVQAFAEPRSLDLDWRHFFAVFVGPENDEIHVHNVQADFRATVRMAVRECLSRGYRRPGFALMNYHASGTNEPIYAQALAERAGLESAHGPQPALFHWNPENGGNLKELHKWIEASRPDCLIASHQSVFHALHDPSYFGFRDIPPVRIPEDLPLVSLRGDPSLPSLAHTALREDEQGVEAMNLIHRHLQYGIVGIPTVPMRMLIPPEFVPGPTLPEKSRKKRGRSGRPAA